VRYRAYTSKGLTAAEVAVLVALCSFTFAYGTMILTGLVLWASRSCCAAAEEDAVPDIDLTSIRLMGGVILGLCALYVSARGSS
jgi:hypothetical protein